MEHVSVKSWIKIMVNETNGCNDEVERLRARVLQLEEKIEMLEDCIGLFKQTLSEVMSALVKLRQDFSEVVNKKNGVPRGRYAYSLGGYKTVNYAIKRIAKLIGGMRC